MKKISQLYRETAAKFVNDSLKGCDSFFLVKYSGISAAAMNNLRQSLNQVNARMFVAKNTLSRRIFKERNLLDAAKLVDGPSAIIFTNGDPAVTSKALYGFSKENDKLKLAGAMLKDKFIDGKGVEALAKLPSREILIGKTVMAIKSPLSGLVFVLNENLRKLVYILDQVKNKKQK